VDRHSLAAKTEIEMNFRENNIGRRPLSSRIKSSASDIQTIDCVTECDWEVFVIRRDEASGSFKTTTACCEDVLDNK
jgi:hypothetical protein